MQEAEKSGKLVAEMKNVSFTWPDGYKVFEDANVIIQRGDRVGLIGDNGAGKTTLLRVLLGELPPTEGAVRLGTNLHISYFDQLRASLDPEEKHHAQRGAKETTWSRWAATLVMWPGIYRIFCLLRIVSACRSRLLSGGERNRLLLAKLFTRPSNLLVLGRTHQRSRRRNPGTSGGNARLLQGHRALW